MRIAIYHNLPFGGAKRALHNYACGLLAAGHTVDVFAPPTADETVLDLRSVASRYVTVPLRAPAQLRDTFAIQELVDYATVASDLDRHNRTAAAMIDAGRYDIAFVHHCRFCGSPWLLRHLSTPSIYYCQEPRRASFEHSVRFDGVLHSTHKGQMLRRARRVLSDLVLRPRDIEAARSADLILANSVFSIESIKRSYGCYARLAYLGIDLSLFRPAADKSECAVLSIGPLERTKRHELVVEAVGAIPPERRPAVYVVAYRESPGYRNTLIELATRLGIALSVHIRIGDAELVDLYNRARVTVCAAELEPFGFVPLEAMACGAPVVAVREGGYRETIVDGVNGLLVDRQASAVGDAIASLLDRGERWEALRQGGLDSAQRWSMEAADARLLEHFAAISSVSAVRTPG